MILPLVLSTTFFDKRDKEMKYLIVVETHRFNRCH